MLRTLSLSASPPCFARTITSYPTLIRTYAVLSENFPGWSLSEIQNLSDRERTNWMNVLQQRYGVSDD